MDGLTFEQFLTNQSVQVDLGAFAINVAMAALLSYLLGLVYVRFGDSLSDRRLFSRNFVLISTTTVLVIAIVKSSLALSLGLVGALSIVRFRAAIKEPEELAFLFLCIAIGLGLGADQLVLTIAAFAIIVALFCLRAFVRAAPEHQNLYLTVNSHDARKTPLSEVTAILRRACGAVDIKRFEERREGLEATFLVEFDDFERLDQARSELLTANPDLVVSFLDIKGVNP